MLVQKHLNKETIHKGDHQLYEIKLMPRNQTDRAVKKVLDHQFQKLVQQK